MSGQVQETASKYFVATTAIPFTAAQVPGGVANGVFVTSTLTAGITLTGLDGVAVAFGNQTLGTYLKFKCTMATFSAGGVNGYA